MSCKKQNKISETVEAQSSAIPLQNSEVIMTTNNEKIMPARHELSGLAKEEAQQVLQAFADAQPQPTLSYKEGMARIEQVLNIMPIPEADNLVAAEVGHYDEHGELATRWGAVIPKNTFKVGDACLVYAQDSYLPEHPELAFMASRDWRVKIMRLRGAPSECLVMPIEPMLPNYKGDLTPGTDVTAWAGVLKYSKLLSADMGGEIIAHFPSVVPKTDEPLFQTVPHLVAALKNQPCYISTKCDGTSQTIFNYQGEFGACSRAYQIKEDQKSAVWQLVERYDLRNKLLKQSTPLALQWECVGPGIQKNPLKLQQVDLRLFNVFDIKRQAYYDVEELFKLAQEFEIPTVPVQTVNEPFTMETSDELRSFAEGFYPNTQKQREGIVIRPMKETRVLNERLSFKVINLLYKE